MTLYCQVAIELNDNSPVGVSQFKDLKIATGVEMIDSPVRVEEQPEVTSMQRKNTVKVAEKTMLNALAE